MKGGLVNRWQLLKARYVPTGRAARSRIERTIKMVAHQNLLKLTPIPKLGRGTKTHVSAIGRRYVWIQRSPARIFYSNLLIGN